MTEEEPTVIGEESDESESGIYRIEKINRITDKNKYLTSGKVNSNEKEFIINTRSPLSIMPADEYMWKRTELQKVKHRHQDVNKNEVKFRGKMPANIEYKSNKQKMQILITKINDNTNTRIGLAEESQFNNQKHPIGREQPIKKDASD